MRLALVILLLLSSSAAAMKWEHFRRSTNIEDRQGPPFWTWTTMPATWVPGSSELVPKSTTFIWHNDSRR